MNREEEILDSIGKHCCTMKNSMYSPKSSDPGVSLGSGLFWFVRISGPDTSGLPWSLITISEQSSLSVCPFSICSSWLKSWGPWKKMWFLPWLSLHLSFKTSLHLGWWYLWLQTPHIPDLNLFTSDLSECLWILITWACDWLPPLIMFIHCSKWRPLTSSPEILWKDASFS